ncbi:MAG: hypothetical protein JRE92_00630 [Deltaproteobacteria bacterium]|nr:hypothetical protein [Deltaproteobacteria bacterium]
MDFCIACKYMDQQTFERLDQEYERILGMLNSMEVKAGGLWREVVRYDCAHGYAHKDYYGIEGKQRKINLYMSYEDALTFAEDDINENWKIYKQRFLVSSD